MTTGAADPLFLDTNILVFASVPEAPLHAIALNAIRHLTRAGAELWVSRQTLREFLATLSRPQSFGDPVPTLLLTPQIRFFERSFRVAEDGPDVTARLLALIERIPTGGKQIHDANFVATMLTYGVGRLLTHNVADFTRFGSLITVIRLATRS